jgi:predicted nucleic acid-binding protein
MTVVDASAVLEMLLRTPCGEACRERLLESGEDICAPHLLDVEVAQVLRRFSLQREIASDRCGEALADLADLALTRYPHVPLLERAWELRGSVSMYDAVYLALAEALEAPLVTCDVRIARAHGHRAKVQLLKRR